MQGVRQRQGERRDAEGDYVIRCRVYDNARRTPDAEGDCNDDDVIRCRVYDNAKANAVMQKAITIIGIEEGLSHNKRESFRALIHEKNSPRVRFYDDDDAEPGGEDLQKVTIMIKVS